jgi:hypothetical protein
MFGTVAMQQNIIAMPLSVIDTAIIVMDVGLYFPENFAA